MSSYSFGVRAVYSAQKDSIYLDRSVWTAWFYVHLLDVLENETWREYTSEAFGRCCRFDDLRVFLGHEDGLNWRSVDETLRMIEIVNKCAKKLEPQRNAPTDKTLQEYAGQTLKALRDRGVAVPHTSTRHAATALGLVGKFASDGNPHGNRDIVTVRSAGDGGNSAAYLAARLKKAGRNDLLEEIGPGKRHKSVRAAAIEAGIIRPVPTVRLVDDHAKVAASIRKHLSTEQIRQLCEELLSTLN